MAANGIHSCNLWHLYSVHKSFQIWFIEVQKPRRAHLVLVWNCQRKSTSKWSARTKKNWSIYIKILKIFSWSASWIPLQSELQDAETSYCGPFGNLPFYKWGGFSYFYTFAQFHIYVLNKETNIAIILFTFIIRQPRCQNVTRRKMT